MHLALTQAFNVNTNYGYYVKDGKVGLGAAEDEWRDYVSWLNKLWEDGLIDQDMLTEDDTTIKDKVHNGKCGGQLYFYGTVK